MALFAHAGPAHSVAERPCLWRLRGGRARLGQADRATDRSVGDLVLALRSVQPVGTRRSADASRLGDRNFFCVRLPQGCTVQDLRERDIAVRDAASFGLAGWVRLSVRPPEAQAALEAALQALKRRATAESSKS